MKPQLDRRVIAPLGVLALCVVIAIVAVVLGRGSEPPPAMGAAGVVPADALAYLHVSTDGTRPAVKRALAVAQRFPDYPLTRAALLARLGGLGGGDASSVDFLRDVRPWLGKEIGVALLNTKSGAAGSLIVIDVANQQAARRFLLRSGQVATSAYRKAQLLTLPQNSQAAFVSHYLAVGQPASVRAAVDVTEGAPALASDSGYVRAVAGDPPGRVLDAYISGGGVRRLLAPQGGLPGALGAVLYQPALLGSSITLQPRSGGIAVRVHSALDAKRLRAQGPRRAMFSPALIDAIPAGAELLLDTDKLDQVAPQLLGAGQASGVLGRLGPLLSRLAAALRAQGYGAQLQQVLSLFHRETVVAIAPGAAGASGSAGSSAGRPTLVILTRAPNQDQARSALADLESPLAQLFQPAGSGPGRAPVFDDRSVAGITAHQLVLGPGLELDYAVFDGQVVISTGLGGIAGVRNHARALTSDPRYRATLANRPDRLTSLLFLDFSQLLSLSESTGLTRSARYRALRPDLQRIRAIGLDSTSGETDSTAELFLQIT